MRTLLFVHCSQVHKFSFKEKKEIDEAYEIIKQIWIKVGDGQNIVANIRPTLMVSPSAETKPSRALPQEDWDLILKGAKTIHVKKDALIIQQGEEFQRIYQINKGTCRTEVKLMTIAF